MDWGILDHGVESAGAEIVGWAIAISGVAILVAVGSYIWWRRHEAKALES